MRITTTLFRAFWLLLLASFAAMPAVSEELRASVDRHTVAVNESFTLTLTFTGQTLSSPDFAALEKDFEILSSQRQQQLTMGFGNDSSSTDWVLTLIPKRTGTLIIPPFQLQSAVSKALTIQVTAAKSSSDTSQAVFMETEVDRETVYVQGQVLLTLRLNTSVMLSSVDIPELTIANARVIKINDNQYQRTLNGREYMVVEMKYAIFPETAGALEIPALQVAGVVPDRNDPFGGRSLFGSRGRAIRLASEAKVLEVLSIPSEADGGAWIPAQGVSISQRWSSKLDELVVGEPVTRTVTVTAQGLPGAQLPPILAQDVPGIRFYPDQPEINETVSSTGVLGSRTESWAIVPTEAGTLQLPPVRVRWWDTEANQLRETVLEGMSIEVAQAPGGATTVPSVPASDALAEAPEVSFSPIGTDASDSKSRLLYGSLFVNGVLIILVLGLGLLLLRRPSSQLAPTPKKVDEVQLPTEKSAFRNLTKTPPSDLMALRTNILAWARLYWPQERITGLADVVRLSGEASLKSLFADLDAALYGHGETDGSPTRPDVPVIIAAVRRVRDNGGATDNRQPALKPLYPVTES